MCCKHASISLVWIPVKVESSLIFSSIFLVFNAEAEFDNISIIGRAVVDWLDRKKNKDDRKKSGLIITHQGHILDYVDADYGLILYKGMIACVGDPYDMLDEISKKGYGGCVEKCLKGFQNSIKT